jgi:hypothetical protein
MYREKNEFRRVYQSISNLLMDEDSDLLSDSYSILNRWNNYFPQLLNLPSVSDVR